MFLSTVNFRLIVLVFCVFLYSKECDSAYTPYPYSKNVTEASSGFDFGNSVVLDSNDNIYMTGTSDGNLFGTAASQDIIVVKYTQLVNNNTLNRVWGKQITSSADDYAYKIILSPDESTIFIAGAYANSPILFELDAGTGNINRNYTYSATINNAVVPAFTDVVFCGTALCLCGFQYTNSSNRLDGILVKLSGSTFTQVWARQVASALDDKLSAITYSNSTGRLWAGGETAVSGAGKEFYVIEINPADGSTVTERTWPGTTCSSAFVDRDQYIVGLLVNGNNLYFLGASTQEFASSGTTTDVCGTTPAAVIGSLNINNLATTQWITNISGISNGFTVNGNGMVLGADGNIYVIGDSDIDVLFNKTNTSPTGFIFDWFYYVVAASNGAYVDSKFSGDVSDTVDDKGGAIDVDSSNGFMTIVTYSTYLSTKYDVTTTLYSKIADPSPTPSIAPTPSITPSTTPSNSVSPSVSSSPSSGYTISASPSLSRSAGGGGGNKNLIIIVGAVLGAAVIGLIAAVMFFVIKRKRDKERRDRMKNMGPDEGGSSSANAVRLSVLESINRNSALLDNWHIDYRQIEIGAEIGRGAYGTVFRGKWRGSTVAVKQLNLEKTDQRAIEDFIKEASAVKRLRNHRNVCQIFGVCSDPEYPICIVMEYMEDGNLQNLVYKGKVHLDVDSIIMMAKHTASGMSHLHSENILHCDLACRNLLVSIGKGNKYLVKISDFGMARVVENEKIYNASSEAQFPVRWSAPEVLSSGTVSRKSDVWSFGVTVWEMIEGVKPYYELSSNKEVIEYVVVNGYRLPRPKKIDIPATLWEIMNQCWSANPAERPEFDEILKKLSNLKKVLKANTKGSQIQDSNGNNVSGNPGGEDYLTIGEFKKGKEVTSVNSDEEYNTLGAKKPNNNNYTNKNVVASTQDDDTYNKVSAKLTTADNNTEDDYKAVIHLKADAQGKSVSPSPSQGEDTYNKINFKNEFSNQNQKGNNTTDESDYLQINKPIFGGPAKQTPTPPPKPQHVEESDYTARVNMTNEFSSKNQTNDSDDYSTVRLNTTTPTTIRKPQGQQPPPQQQQQPAEEDNYSKVVLKTNSSGSNGESDYNVINFKKDEKKPSNDQDLYLNNNKKDMK